MTYVAVIVSLIAILGVISVGLLIFAGSDDAGRRF